MMIKAKACAGCGHAVEVTMERCWTCHFRLVGAAADTGGWLRTPYCWCQGVANPICPHCGEAPAPVAPATVKVKLLVAVWPDGYWEARGVTRGTRDDSVERNFRAALAGADTDARFSWIEADVLLPVAPAVVIGTVSK